MERQKIKNSMLQFTKGAHFITAEQFCQYMGISRSTAKRKLRDLEKIDGKYYFIPDVVDELLRPKRGASMQSQCTQILDHLQSGKELTQAEAVRKWDCYRLSGRIHDLRKQGYVIQCRKEPNKKNKGSHGVYWMEEAKQ